MKEIYHVRRIYVASSWRNIYQQSLVAALRGAGHEVYDFKNPTPGNTGFHWSEIDPDWQSWTHAAFVEALAHPVADSGFGLDWDAMRWADTCVMVWPCGNSAHLEAGYFVGSPYKKLYILLMPGYDDEVGFQHLRDQRHSLNESHPCPACGDLDGCHLHKESQRRYILGRKLEPELMYKMADGVYLNVADLVKALS